MTPKRLVDVDFAAPDRDGISTIPEGVDHAGGGEWANVATNWLRWQFKGDKQAAKMFVGKDCSLCTNSNWDAASKHLQ